MILNGQENAAARENGSIPKAGAAQVPLERNILSKFSGSGTVIHRSAFFLSNFE